MNEKIEHSDFDLLHYFLSASLVALVIAAILLGWLYSQFVLDDLIRLAESKNVALTQAFANSQWPEFAHFVASSTELNKNELRRHPQTAKLQQAILTQMKDVGVVKVKIYNLNGLTVFSTEESQIGADKSNSPSFRAARSGQIVSNLTHRDPFHAFDNGISERHILFTYIPIRRDEQTAKIEGIFELYSDVTPWFHKIQQTQWRLFGGILVILTSLYIVLFLIVRHEKRIIDHQGMTLRKLSQAVEQGPDIVIITDLQGNIEYVNSKFVEITGYTREEVLGHNSRILKSGAQSKSFYRQLWQTILSGQEWHGEFHNKRKDGTYYWEHATIAPIHNKKGRMTHFLAIKGDVSEQKRAEQALRESEERFRKVIEHDVDAIIVIDKENIVRFINPAAKTLFKLQSEDLIGKQFGIPAVVGETTEFEIPRRDGSVSIVEIRTVEIDWQNEPAYLESLRDITAHKQAEEALRESQHRLEASYQREHERLQLSDTLREIARIVSSSLRQQEVLTLIFDQLANVMTYHRATVSLLEHDNLALVDGRDKMGGTIKQYTYPAYKYPLNSEVLTNKHPVLIPDVKNDTRWQHTNTMLGVRSMIFAPLLVQEHPIGILAVSRIDDVPYTDHDARIVFVFATQVAIAMHNAQLYDATQKRNRKLALLHDISLTMTSTLDLHTLLTAVCRKLVTSFHCDHSGVLLFDDTYTYGEVVAEYPPGDALDIRIPLAGYAAAREIKKTGKPLAVYDAQHDPLMEKVWPIMTSLGIRSILITPLIVKDRTIGSFSLDITTAQRHFEATEIGMAQTIASQLAVAIENARWMEKEHKRLEEEIETARRIQTSLLPLNVPEVQGLDLAGFSRPARQVGGDFYNYFVFNREHVGVAVGDVSGKGMQAALMMALSVGLLTTKLHKEMLPAELLSELNYELQPHTSRNWMNTAFSYVALAPTANHAWNLCVANAGMVAPLIRRKNGSMEWLDISGLPLGMTDEIKYEEQRNILSPGDILLLGSDGVVDAENSRGEMYGTERLTTCVASAPHHNAQIMLKQVLDDIHRFVGNAEATDDLTMVVVVARE